MKGVFFRRRYHHASLLLAYPSGRHHDCIPALARLLVRGVYTARLPFTTAFARMPPVPAASGARGTGANHPDGRDGTTRLCLVAWTSGATRASCLQLSSPAIAAAALLDCRAEKKQRRQVAALLASSSRRDTFSHRLPRCTPSAPTFTSATRAVRHHPHSA